jgi:hypothetical protein
MSQPLCEVHVIMSQSLLRGGWSPVSAAPRDGTPVILWLVEDDTPPVLPRTVGFWLVDTISGSGCWRIFGELEGAQSCSDEQIRGWRQLLL